MFVDRIDAGQRLGRRLRQLWGEPRDTDLVVLGLPRGGVPVAAEVARALDAPLDIIVVRKLGVPFQPELAMGAIGENGVQVLAQQLIRRAGITEAEVAEVERQERAELARRIRLFRGDRAAVPLTGRTVVIVDDGIATGATARAACQVARALGAARVVVAVPVAPPEWTRPLDDVADELVCLVTPKRFSAIGRWYADFSQTSDEEVIACLRAARAGRAPAEQPTKPVPAGTVATAGTVTAAEPPAEDPPGRQPDRQPDRDGDREQDRGEDIEVPAGGVLLPGRLTVPQGASGIVVFAHGSGSSRHSPRNRFVARVLNQAGLGTLLLDLLTRGEELDRSTVFDIELLACRLADTTAWLRTTARHGDARIGYFGASTGAAAALWAAAEPYSGISALVSRGGRPDLASSRLAAVSAPTLLIVGGLDEPVLALNRRACSRLRAGKLVVVPGATHLFAEPGTLGQVAELARNWFIRHLAPQPAPAP